MQEEKEIVSSETENKGSKKNRMVGSVASVISGSFLSKQLILRNIPFILFLSALAICYIANGYFADDQIRKVNQLTSEIKELHTQYIVVKDSLVMKSKQTEVARSLSKMGIDIKESVVPAKKIVLKQKNNK
jgi:Bacteriodetes cell division protein (FtsL-like)